MKIVVIGLGSMGKRRLRLLSEHKDLQLFGIDSQESRCEEVKEKFGIICFNSIAEAVEKEDIKAAVISTSPLSHASIIKECLTHNLHVFTEINLVKDGYDENIAMAKEKGLVVCANHQNRFNKSIQRIRKAVEDGSFGKMLYGTAHIRWNRGKDYYTQAPWRGTWAQDGGALMNQCIHNIDLLRWMMGDEVTEVCAYTDNLNHDYIEAEDLGMAIVKFKNGSYGIIEGTTDIYPKNLEETLYLFGQKGTVKAGGKSVNIIEEWLFENEKEDQEKVKQENSEMPKNIYGFGHTPLYKNVIEAIQNHTKPLVDAEAGKRALELVLAIYKSAAEGKPVKLPLDKCSTTDFTGRFGK